jgi:hypothetical protein
MRSAKVGCRVVVLALLLSCVRAVNTEAQVARSGKEPAVAVERTLFTLEEDWTRALVRRDGAAFDGRFRYTDTWLYRGDRWRVIAAHDYLVPERR